MIIRCREALWKFFQRKLRLLFDLGKLPDQFFQVHPHFLVGFTAPLS
jgi:hypothetical protein